MAPIRLVHNRQEECAQSPRTVTLTRKRDDGKSYAQAHGDETACRTPTALAGGAKGGSRQLPFSGAGVVKAVLESQPRRRGNHKHLDHACHIALVQWSNRYRTQPAVPADRAA
jgi:hypothetical protein